METVIDPRLWNCLGRQPGKSFILGTLYTLHVIMTTDLKRGRGGGMGRSPNVTACGHKNRFTLILAKAMQTSPVSVYLSATWTFTDLQHLQDRKFYSKKREGGMVGPSGTEGCRTGLT